MRNIATIRQLHPKKKKKNNNNNIIAKCAFDNFTFASQIRGVGVGAGWGVGCWSSSSAAIMQRQIGAAT